ncbi:hypothetical protein E4U42_003022 [Claviceps africana]|uniref:Uncharacterized protein n=1 Tax=Claviceps africana TaxID=83212 RepID=A0A8K0J786_9HYPO|nr:hypothetical protein E4U42_003022 [Claviceps africana]
MERASSKPADVTLLSACHSVANYSYPRKSTGASFSMSPRSRSRCSSTTSQFQGRESLGSEESAPGLMEDPGDSEVSCDDDDHYLTEMTQLWDSFWRNQSPSKGADYVAVPSEQYPALIPSPHKRRPSRSHAGQATPAWPLPNASPSSTPQRQSIKPAARYSVFPKTAAAAAAAVRPPTSRSLSTTQSRAACRRQQTRPQSSHKTGKPLRPPRPAEGLLTPCIQRPRFVPVSFIMSDFTIQKNEDLSPVSPTSRPRPATSSDDKVRGSWDGPSGSRPYACTIYSVISKSATHLPVPEIRPSPSRAPRPSKSVAALPTCRFEPEPHSVFEDDSDDEAGESPGKKFFSFHKRAHSDHKRWRNRANTMSVVPSQGELHRPLLQQKRHGRDVFGRILGRRSR